MKLQNVGAMVGRLYALLSLAVLVPVLSLAFLAKGQADAAPLAVAPSRTCSATYQESPSVPYAAVAHIGGTKFAVGRNDVAKILIVDYAIPPSSYDYASNYITAWEWPGGSVNAIIDIPGTNYFVVVFRLSSSSLTYVTRYDKSSYAFLNGYGSGVAATEVPLAWDTTNGKLIKMDRSSASPPQTFGVYTLDGTLYKSYTLDSNLLAVRTIAHLGGTYVAHAGYKLGQAAKIVVVDYETGQVVNNITAGDSTSDSTIPSLVKEPGQDRLYSAQQYAGKTKIWNTNTWTSTSIQLAFQPKSLAPAYNGSEFFIGGSSSYVAAYDANTRVNTFNLIGNLANNFALASKPYADVLAGASNSTNSIVVWKWNAAYCPSFFDQPENTSGGTLTGIGAIAGTPQVGSTLTAGAVTPAGATVTYQWLRATSAGGPYSAISGATAGSYAPVTGDAGYYIEVQATGTGSYSGAATSAPVGPVTGGVTTYTLAYTAGPGGAIGGTSPQTVSSGGSGTPVTAVPNAGYHFLQWSDGSTANPRTDSNVTANVNVTASFAINTHTLTYTAGANGSISGASPQTVNHGGGGSQVTAVPNPGYHFVQWSDGSTANPRTDTNVTADVSVTASFVPGSLDQQQPTYNFTSFYINGSSPGASGAYQVAQTFTPGISGHLTEVQLYLAAGSSPTTLTIKDTPLSISGEVFTGAALATATIPVPDSAGWRSFVFNSPATLLAGHQYAFVL